MYRIVVIIISLLIVVPAFAGKIDNAKLEFLKAKRAYQSQQLEKAIKHVENVINILSGTNYKCQLYLVRSYYGLKQFGNADREYKKYIEIIDSYPENKQAEIRNLDEYNDVLKIKIQIDDVFQADDEAFKNALENAKSQTLIAAKIDLLKQYFKDYPKGRHVKEAMDALSPLEVEAERQRIEEERRRKAEAEKQRIEEERRKKVKAERQRIEEERRREAEAERQRIEKEKKRKAEAEKQRIEKEKKRKAEVERQRIEKEKKRKAEVERQRIEKENEKKRKLEIRLSEELGRKINIAAVEGNYIRLVNNIIYDQQNRIEWIIGQSKANYASTKSWISKLELDGRGWRLPTKNELEKFCFAMHQTRVKNLIPHYSEISDVWTSNSKIDFFHLTTDVWTVSFSYRCESYLQWGNDHYYAFAIRTKGKTKKSSSNSNSNHFNEDR